MSVHSSYANLIHLTPFGLCRVALLSVLSIGLSACDSGGGSGGGVSEPVTIAAALPEGDHVVFSASSITLSEGNRRATVQVVRTGSAVGDTSVRYRFNDQTASRGSDYIATDGELTWAAGDASERSISFLIASDLETEVTETLSIELFDLAGSETLGSNYQLPINITDLACTGVLPTAINGNTHLSNPCYRLDSTLMVGGDATLSIAAGTTIHAATGVGLSAIDQAVIDSQGTEELPVLIAGAMADAGYWQGIMANGIDSELRLTHTTINDAVIGVDVIRQAKLSSFSGNHINNSSQAAMRLVMTQSSVIDSNTGFTGNASGVVLLGQTISNTDGVSVPAINTYYEVSGNLILDSAIVLAPGVDMRFGRNVSVFVSAQASLNAVGTESSPIRLSGLESEPGYWNGIQFSSSTSDANSLMHVTVADGGGDPSRPANVFIDSNNVRLSIVHSQFNNSAAYGLVQVGNGDTVTLEDVSYSGNRSGGFEQR